MSTPLRLFESKCQYSIPLSSKNPCDSFILSINFRCIHLAQPPLDQNEIQQIEQIISIYVNDDAYTMETSSTADSNEHKVYTLEDDVQPSIDTKANPNSNETTSIWREAPGTLKK